MSDTQNAAQSERRTQMPRQAQSAAEESMTAQPIAAQPNKAQPDVAQSAAVETVMDDTAESDTADLGEVVFVATDAAADDANDDADDDVDEDARAAQAADTARKKKKAARAAASFIIGLVLLVALFFAAVNIGSLQVSFPDLLRGLFVEYDDTVATIYDLRFPRIFISMLAGAAVAVSGALFQAVLKNPLVDPGIIGISGGAGFVAVLITAFFPMLYFFTPLFAFFGGVIAFALVYTLSWKGGLSPLRIILVGVATSAMFSGLSSAFNSMGGGDYSGVASIVEGNITMKTWSDVYTLLPYVLIGLIVAFLLSQKCNLLSLEDKAARSLGVNVNAVRIGISMIAVLLASISTAVVGAISFLGLIVPHIGRLLVGSDHRTLLPFSAVLGAFTFLLADTIGRTVAYPYEVAAAVIMSVIGGPFFIMLLRGSKKYAR